MANQLIARRFADGKGKSYVLVENEGGAGFFRIQSRAEALRLLDSLKEALKDDGSW